MRRTLIMTMMTLLVGLILTPRTAGAQTHILETHADYLFDDHITFYARLKSDVPVENATIFFHASNDTHTHIGSPKITYMGSSIWALTYVHQIEEYPLPAYTNINYRYDIALKDQQELIQTSWYSFNYDDNRFDWDVLIEEPLQVHWYEGDFEFGQNILDVAQEGLDKIHNLLKLPIPNPTRIYVYPDAEVMKAALSPASANWVAGHADPELGVIVVSLPKGPDQVLLIEQRVPHELMHIALYESTTLGYANLPTWFSEGLASQVELYPNPDYRIMLEYSLANDSLLPMSNLCKSFPRDVSNALLAYAQADSFTRYLYSTYGTPGLEKLVTNYANGLDCDHGAKAALGKDLDQLERNWRGEIFNENLALTAVNNLLPWLVVLFLVLSAPLGLAFYLWWTNRGKEQPVSAFRESPRSSQG